MTWSDLFPQGTCPITNIEFQETNSPLTERQAPSDFHAVRSSRHNTQQPKPQKTYHEVLGQEGNPEQHQQSISKPAAYVSSSSSPTMNDYSSPDLETALLRAMENGDIGPNCTEGKHHAEGTGVTNEAERSGWDAGVENDFQLFECHDITTNLGQAGLGSVIEDAKGFAGLQSQGKSCRDILSAPVPGRRKFVVPKLPDFNKLLERCIW